MFILFSVITILFILIASAAYAGFRAAPWVPTWGKDFDRVVRLADLKSGEIVYELGAGEGRLLLQFAHTPAAEITGFEISLVPYAIAWLRVRRLRPRVSVRFKDFSRLILAKRMSSSAFLPRQQCVSSNLSLPPNVSLGRASFHTPFRFPAGHLTSWISRSQMQWQFTATSLVALDHGEGRGTLVSSNQPAPSLTNMTDQQPDPIAIVRQLLAEAKASIQSAEQIFG